MATETGLSFRFGDMALLETGGQPKEQHRVQLLGGLPDKSLLVTAPQIGGIAIPVAVGTGFSVRVLNGDAAQTFRATVLRACTAPYPYLHLSYPDKVESKVARGEPRATLNLPATAQRISEPDFELPDPAAAGSGIAVTIRDLSTSGAKLESSHTLGEEGAKLLLLTTFNFERAASHAVVLPAEIRYVRISTAGDGSASYAYGVQFVGLPVAADHALAAFVYRHLISRLLRDPDPVEGR